MNTEKVISRDNDYILHTYGRSQVVLAEGEGMTARDADGKSYLDFTSGIGVNSLGYCHPAWVRAVADQAATLQHTSNLYYTAPDGKLAKKLCRRTGLDAVFFGNSGAEANEGAIKCARKYSVDTYGESRNKVITLVNSFHGRTLATLTATGQDVFHHDFGPFPGNFDYVPAGDFAALEKAADKDTCAVMMELVQGEGGVMPLEEEFVAGLAKIAAEEDILLMADEVQTGNGRTGMLYGYMNYGITPDIVTTAKGLGGGLPIGVCLLGEKVKDTLGAGSHGSTFGGNPAVCAGALNILSRIDENLLAEVRKKSVYIFESLTGAAGIKSVTGLGLMIGVETEKPAGEVIDRCREDGVLVINAKSKVRLLPPLNIPWELLEKAVSVIKAACAD